MHAGSVKTHEQELHDENRSPATESWSRNGSTGILRVATARLQADALEFLGQAKPAAPALSLWHR